MNLFIFTQKNLRVEFVDYRTEDDYCNSVEKRSFRHIDKKLFGIY